MTLRLSAISLSLIHIFWIMDESKLVDKIMGSVNIDDYESRQYMDRMLQSAGIYAKLEEMGIEEGAPVVIGEFEFEYVY